jgi:beta-ribofuranosylaminobenzene 5'-phosphate synthase
LRARGVTGLGQSSWGPTGFAFADSQAEAERLLAIASEAAGSADDGAALEIVIAKGRNEGAEIGFTHPEAAKNLGSTGV